MRLRMLIKCFKEELRLNHDGQCLKDDFRLLCRVLGWVDTHKGLLISKIPLFALTSITLIFLIKPFMQNHAFCSIRNYISKIRFEIKVQIMKEGNHLLFSVLGKKSEVKGKTPTGSSKVIQKSKETNKQLVKAQAKIQSQKKLKQKQKKPQIVEQIQKLQKKLKQTSSQIEQTQKKLDVDLFLKTQKQKRQQYAKNIQKQYEIQKKLRQQKLYKKYNRGDKKQQQQTPNEDQVLTQTKNVKTTLPLQLFKILQGQKISISKSSSIINGHHIVVDDIFKNDKLKQDLFDSDKITKQENELLFVSDKQSITTASLKCLAQNMLNIYYFPIRLQPSSLQPCQQYQNLMNSLSLMPQQISTHLYSSFQYQSKNYFLCKMYFNGIRKSILISDVIQTREFSHKHINVMSKVSGNRNFGPTLIQKAYRKVSANYHYLTLKQAVYTLYGLDLQILPISNKSYVKQNFQKIVKLMLDNGQIVAFINDNDHNSSIYQNRLYKLKQIITTVEFLQAQSQKKPAKKKKKGQSTTQNIELHERRQFKTLYNLQNPYKGLVLDSKGLNKFELMCVFEKFNKIVFVRDYPKSWKCKRICCELFSTGPLIMTSNEWTKNNQYNFTITQPINLRIVMRRQLSSSSQSILNKENCKEIDLEGNNLYGFLVFVIKEGEQKVTCFKMDALIAKTNSNNTIQAASFCKQFTKASYIIIPYSNKISQNSYQFFHIDFFVQKQQALIFGKAIINQWKWVQSNKNQKDQKSIQSLQSRQVIQKTKIQDVQMNKVSQTNIDSDKILKVLEKQNLILQKDLKLSDVLIPGKLSKFLIRADFDYSKEQTKKKQKTKKGNQKKLNSNKTNTQNQQILCLEREQQMQILLGYDVLQGQDINRGLMQTYLQQEQDIYDFQNYNLGKQGLTCILQTLMVYPTITKLNLNGNQLDDSNKGNRVELRELKLENNKFGKIAIKAIKGIMARFQNLQVFY